MERYEFSSQQRAAMEGLQAPFAIYQFLNKRVVTLILSEGFLKLFGYEDRAQAYYDMDNDMYKDAHPDDVARIANAAFYFATEGGAYEVIYRTRKKNSPDYKIIHARGEHVYPEPGVQLAHVWYTDEGSYVANNAPTPVEMSSTLSNALHEQSLLKASQYDFLTGLPSMTYFFELADAARASMLKAGGSPAILYMDFAGMRFYNSRHGFAQGDKMLKAFSRLLVREFSNESCCRISADHFAVVAEVNGLDEKLNRIFRDFAELGPHQTPPVHVGIYPYRVEDVSVSTACDRAKLAASALSGTYVSAFSDYNVGLRDEALLKQYIIENLDTAIREKWIQVYIQPIIRAVNERVCDVEALARWNDPNQGFLSPASFIPTLEEAGLIYKLDLCVVDQVLDFIKKQTELGLTVVPHSVNLSRSDFDACDIVEEIRRRVDAAGVRRDRITIEITESVIGGDFEFMKGQVERFRRLGFPVWMDDFGSGYSSLDVLQSIQFDLIKFDMSFMRKLDAGENARTILTELMRMANALGVDTVCEGVESEAQVRFLREIGCSKLQGYYYRKPESIEFIFEQHRDGTLIQTENPKENEYYESIGRLNLFDLSAISRGDHHAFQNTFETLPIAVLEMRNGKASFIRSTRSYREFVRRFFGEKIIEGEVDFCGADAENCPVFASAMKQCCQNSSRAFFDERLPDGSVVHSFARRINVNPVTGSAAVAVAVLSITEPDDSATYADIARALAADYYNIYVIDLDTDHYIEYTSQVGGEELSIERHGEDFFASARRDTMTRIYEEDREPFLKWFTRENVLHELDTQGVFTTTYRLIDTGRPMYVNMKITRMQGGNRIILGVSIVDAQMKQQEEEKKLRREKAALSRIAALSDNYIVLYTVDPVTGHYVQYSPSKAYESIGLAKRGEDFFTDVRLDTPKAIHPEDMERHLRVLTKENMMREIQQNGHFIHNYRLLMNGHYVPVSLKATLVEEDDGEKILLGVSIVD